MGPGGASQIGPVPLLRCHAIPLPCYPLPIPCRPILPFPSHPNTPSHPTVGNLSLVLSKGTRGREREKKTRRSLPMGYAAAAGLELSGQSVTDTQSLPQDFPPTRPSPHSDAPAQHPRPEVQPGGAWAVSSYFYSRGLWTSWQYSGATPRSTASIISTYVNVLISHATSQSTSAPTVCLPSIYGQISSFHAAGGCV